MPQQRDCRGQEKTRKQQSVPRESGRVSKGGCVLKQPWAWGRRTLPGRLALVPTKQYPHVNTSHTWARTYTSNTSPTYITMCTHLHSHMHIETHTHTCLYTHSPCIVLTLTYVLTHQLMYSMHTLTCSHTNICIVLIVVLTHSTQLSTHRYTHIQLHSNTPSHNDTILAYKHTPIHRHTVHLLDTHKHSTHMYTHRNTDVHLTADILILHINFTIHLHVYTTHTHICIY